MASCTKNFVKGLLFLVPVVISACRTTAETTRTDVVKETRLETINQSGQRFDESFDPAILNDQDWVIKKKTYRGVQTIHAEVDSGRTGLRKNNENEHVAFGFRVQLYSTTDYFIAMAVRDEAGSKLNEDIYVDYEPPYYKVRAGNYTVREQAEETRNLAKSLGYQDAWIIRTNVLIKNK